MLNGIFSILLIIVILSFATGFIMLILRIWNVGKPEYLRFPFLSGLMFAVPLIPLLSGNWGLAFVFMISAIVLNINLYFSIDGVWFFIGKMVLSYLVLVPSYFLINNGEFVIGLYLSIPAILTMIMLYIEGSREILKTVLIIFGMLFIPILISLISSYIALVSIIPVILFTLTIFDKIELKYSIRITITLIILAIPIRIFVGNIGLTEVIDSIDEIMGDKYKKLINLIGSYVGEVS